ncbi:hypothetical protein DW954_02710 [Clostridium sp. AM45-5]|nr:hypothetical protein [Clostridium sp. AM45-5]RHS68266.1 hypothetical protein DW954_02710 [Clostridium sp. AM45-5]
MIQKCRKCGSSSLFTEQMGSNIGLYCSSCGSWQKWLNKNEVRLFTENNKVEGSCVHVDDGLRDRLEEFVQALDDMIDKEFSKEPISDMDAMRKSAYCLALERDKNSIINILEGRKYWEIGE